MIGRTCQMEADEMRRVEVGDVLHIRKFGAHYGNLWARVAAPPEDDTYWCELWLIACDFDLLPEYAPDWTSEWPLDRGDIWEIVPEELVPDWAWATQAKRELLR